MAMVITPSIMNNQRQARRPLAPSRFLVIPAEINPEKAPDSNEPEYSTAVLNPSSFLVYHEERKNKQPGK